MFAMLKQFFRALEVLFTSMEKLASATNHLSTWAEESAGSFADEARVQRLAKLNALNKEHNTTVSSTAPAQLPAP